MSIKGASRLSPNLSILLPQLSKPSSFSFLGFLAHLELCERERNMLVRDGVPALRKWVVAKFGKKIKIKIKERRRKM
jgi:hypothetical protein